MSKPRPRLVPPRAARVPSLRHRRPTVEALEARALMATLVVNTNLDGNDPTAVTLSLREAIELSNNDGSLPLASLSALARLQVTGTFVAGVPNVIDFNIAGAGIHTISPATKLPAITAPVSINGYSQPGSSINPSDETEVDINSALVRIDGSALAAPATDGLDIMAANCLVDGLIVTGFSGAGVSISGAGSQGNWLWGNFFGALPDSAAGRVFASNSGLGNLGEGVQITSSNNRVGGNTPGLPNVIANNGYNAAGVSVGGAGVGGVGAGLFIDTTGGTGNLIQGNVIVNNAAQGVFVRSSNNTIGEALAGGGNVIGGNGAQGIEITGGPTVQGNQVVGNLVGTDLGTSDNLILKGTIAYPNHAQGILIQDSPKNFIGGASAAARNVIGQNDGDGVAIAGLASTANRVLNNDIGFNIVNSLIVFLPNNNGVSVTSPGNIIGDPTGVSPNTIADNRNDGILISGAAASGNLVAGNVIGLNPDGGSAFPNSFDGVHIDNAPGNTIGGTTVGARNTISSNNNGVYILGAGSTGNLVEGNFIGTGTDGVTDLGNAVDGVVLDNAPSNTVGGTAAGAGNVISGNNRGVRVTGAGSTGDLVQGNFIGTDLTATQVITNKIDGVFVTAGASNNQIGGLASGAGNTIADNVGAGVNLDSGTGNAIQSNSIFTNTLAGIVLNTATDADNLQPAPVLTFATPNTTSTLIQGTLTAAANTTYSVQFFANPTQPAVGFEQGQAPLYTAQLTTDGSGHVLIAQRVPVAVATGQYVTATATDPAGDTSVFSGAVQAVPVGVQFSAAAYSVSESGGSVTITVTRTAGSNGTDTVDYSVGGGTAVAGTDYQPTAGTLTFNPGVLSQTFSVPVIDANKVGGSVALNLTLSNPTNNATLGSPSVSTLTILDNDQPTVRLASAVASVNENAGTLQFTVTRNSPVGVATVQYATADGTAKAGVNYTATAGTITFNPNETVKTINVPILDDGVVTGALGFTLALSSPVNVALGAPTAAAVTEFNTDTPVGNTPSETIVVTTTNDDTNPNDGTISLREAILMSNANHTSGVPNVIDFALGGSGVQTIRPLTPLPTITQAVVIDGYYQTGATLNVPGQPNPDVASLTVQVDGSSVVTAPGQKADGLDIAAPNSVVDGLIITGFTGAGVSISGSNSHGNWLWGNFIGTTQGATGGPDYSSNPAFRNGTGVLVTASNNLVGGSDVGLRNVIDNNGIGLVLDTQTGVGTLVENNLILDNVTQGVLVTSSNNTIGGQTAGLGNIISGNGSDGVLITGDPVSNPYTSVTLGTNVQGNGVFGNQIGLDLVGTRPRINPYQQQWGVRVEDSARNNIGGVLVGGRNVIAGNVLDGINIDGLASTGNHVLNNWIGFTLNAPGLPPYNGASSPILSNLTYLPNRNGISITSPGNVIGGTDPGDANTISNNRLNGVLLSGPGASGNTIQGNVIGLTPSGSAALGNAFDGIRINNAPSNLIGGTSVAARNTISGNNNGVYLIGAGATGNTVEGNFIGTAADGVTDLGNAVDGVVLDNAPLNTIGGSDTITASSSVILGNVISGNNRGIRVTGPGSTGNRVQGNFIGTDLTGAVFLHNEIDGILVTAGASGNTIGASGLGNTISNNIGDGVDFDPTSGGSNQVLFNVIGNNNAAGVNLNGGTGTSVLSNSIYGNSGAGIAVNQVAPQLSIPVISSTTPGASSTLISGAINDPAAPNTAFTVQFFATPGARPAAGHEQGQTLLLTARVTTDANGYALIAQRVPLAVPSDQSVTATATDPAGNTSAFSQVSATSVQFGAGVMTVFENAGVLTFTVNRNSSSGVASVNYATADGTARAGVNYAATSGTLTFYPGDTSKTVTVPVIDDGVVTGPLKFTLALSNPVNLALGAPATATVNELNTDTTGNPPPVALTITVNTTFDPVEAVGTIDPNGSTISLREAIELSNGQIPLSKLNAAQRALVTVAPVFPAAGNPAPPNTIDFNIPGSGVETITVSSALPTVVAPVSINGYSQPGSAIGPASKTEVDLDGALIQVDGSALATPATDGLAIATSNCVVDGLIVTGFSGAGISISGAMSQGNWLWGNFLGALPDTTFGKNFEVNPLAAVGLSQPQIGNLGEGIRVASSNNRIGGNTPGLANVMGNNGYDSSGSAAGGVGLLIDTGGTGNLVQGNVIVNNAAEGILLRASNNTIGEATHGGGNVIGANGAAGVMIDGSVAGANVQGNQLLGNFIGTDMGTPDNLVKKGFVALPNVGQGVLIEDSPKNTIGGYGAAAGNIIGSNLLDGVEIDGDRAIGNRLLSNSIGFDEVGGVLALLPNQNGVSITSSGNFVGDATGQGANTISNNRNNGVLLSGAGAFGNTIASDLIGLNPGGASAFPNAFDGVHIANAPNNLIGGATAAARNTISANNNGVYIVGAGATGNTVEGNFIGTGVDGVTDLGNAIDGVVLDNAPRNVIGGMDTFTTSTDPTTGATTIARTVTLGNVISGNNRGVRISGAGSTGDLVQGNFIGTDLTETADIANSIDGVLVTAGASNNSIGGLALGLGNTIAFDAGEGVDLDSGTGNAVLTNGIFSNAASGFLLPAGISLNPVNNADHLQPAPVLTSVVPDATLTQTNVQGTLTAAPNTTYSLQFFASDTPDRTGFGQGETPLMTPATDYAATVTTNAAGKAVFSVNLPSVVTSGQFVTATATALVANSLPAAPVGDTSAFSNALPAVPVSVQLASASDLTNEAAGAVAITVTRVGGQASSVAVNFSVGGGTATAGVDYTPVSGTLVFQAGQMTQTFTVPILDAQKVGGSVSVNVTLSNPAGGATLGMPSTAVLTIQDIDGPGVGFPSGAATFQSPGVATITVNRNTANGVATVHYTTSDGTALAGVNYVATSGTLTFNPGQTSQTIPVTLLDDSQLHPAPLTFGVTLSQPTGAALSGISHLMVFEVTPNAPGVFQLPTVIAAVGPGSTSVAVTVVRGGGKTGTVTVDYLTGGGTARPNIDFTPVSGTLTFGPGVTSMVVYVPVFNTSQLGTNTKFIFAILNPTGGASLGYVTNTVVSILHPNPGGPVGNTAPPTVTAILPVAGATGFNTLVVTFSRAMNPARAATAGNYAVTLNGHSVPVTRAVYDPTANHTVLTLAATVPFGAFARLDIHGLADATGILLDGSGSGHNPGSTFSGLIGEGRQLTYTDRTGDAVSLALSGPGYLDLWRGLDGEAEVLRFVSTTANLSTLTGRVVPRTGQTGTTSIPSITAAAGVRIRLSSPPFYLGGITPTAVDALAVSGSLSARRGS